MRFFCFCRTHVEAFQQADPSFTESINKNQQTRKPASSGSQLPIDANSIIVQPTFPICGSRIRRLTLIMSMDNITLLLKLRHEALGAANVGERREF